ANDLQVAEAHFGAAAEHEPQAWFAVGWLAAQRAPVLKRAQAALNRLEKAPRPWRRG
ncbi:MAG: inorganic triphosphatase, partial [Chitinophagaceae bacterium]|nr:inorganic triphosphatase [Rubrivivax sp.]